VFAYAGAAFLAAAATLSVSEPRACCRASEGAKPEYVSPDVCKRCHYKQYQSWKKGPLPRAFEVLRPGGSPERRAAAGIQVDKDYTREPDCLRCHTTGYGTASGYPARRDDTPMTVEETSRARQHAGIGCEACHGPGSLYTALMREKEDFKVEEIRRLGATWPPTAKECAGCHANECPAMPADYQFDFAKAKMSDRIHVHVPLKYPH
jgi:hypothetical protein